MKLKTISNIVKVVTVIGAVACFLFTSKAVDDIIKMGIFTIGAFGAIDFSIILKKFLAFKNGGLQ